MSSDNPISDIAEGTAKGFLDWSVDKIGSFIKRLKNKELAFIEEPKTIEIVREQYRSGEAKFYEIYIKDKNLLFLVKLGLTLRKLESDKERLQNLRDKILKKHDIEGLHIAEFVQNGILNNYVSILLKELTSLEKLTEDIEQILKNIEKYTIFVLGTSNKSEIIKNADIKVNSHSPKIFIISGFKSAAKIVAESIDKFKIILKDYEFERFSSGEKETLFFKRKRDNKL